MKTVKRSILSLLAIVILAGFNGCGTVDQQISKPKNLEESIAVAYITYTSVVKTTNELLQKDIITVEQAQYVRNGASHARLGLDLARTLEKTGKPIDAKSTLDLAVKSLSDLQSYLEKVKK